MAYAKDAGGSGVRKQPTVVTPQAAQRRAEERAANEAAAQQDAQNDAWKNVIDYSTPSNLTSNGQTITNTQTGQTYSTPNYAQQRAEAQAQQARQEQMRREREQAMEELRQQELARQQDLQRTAEEASAYIEPEPVVQEPEQKKGGNLVIPEGYRGTDSNSGTSTTAVYTPKTRDYTDEEISQMQRDRTNLVVPRSYSPVEQRKENNAGLPTAKEEDQDQLGIWQVLQNTPDSSDTPVDDWGRVIDNGSALAGTNYNVPYGENLQDVYDDAYRIAIGQAYSPEEAELIAQQRVEEARNAQPVPSNPTVADVVMNEDILDQIPPENLRGSRGELRAEAQAPEAPTTNGGRNTEPEMVFPTDTGGTTAYNPSDYIAETPEQKRDRLARETEKMLNGNNNQGSSFRDTVNGVGDWLLENLIGTSLADSPVADVIDQAGNDVLRKMVGDDLANLISGEEGPTTETKQERLARETAEAIANGTINNVPQTNNGTQNSGGQTGIEDVIDDIMNDQYRPETNEEKRKRLENVNKYLAENGYTPEAYNTLEKRAILEDLNNYLSENGYTPEAYNAYYASSQTPSGNGSSSGTKPAGSQVSNPSYGQGGQVVKAPYKEGGYTEQELMNMGNKSWGLTYGYPSYEGYYRAPDGHYYPVDQEKAAYYIQNGTYNGWDEGMRDYYNTFGTFSGYTPTWQSTGRNTGGGGSRSYSYSGGSGSYSGYYGGNNYSGNNNSNVQPELTNQTRQRINNIMRNWTF